MVLGIRVDDSEVDQTTACLYFALPLLVVTVIQLDMQQTSLTSIIRSDSSELGYSPVGCDCSI